MWVVGSAAMKVALKAFDWAALMVAVRVALKVVWKVASRAAYSVASKAVY